MDRFAPPPALHHRLIGPLHVEAMLLADEARAYFDLTGKRDRGRLDPIARVAFSCESLKLTTRLMHVTSWLLTQRAREAGEVEARPVLTSSRALGIAPETAEDVLALTRDLVARTGCGFLMVTHSLHLAATLDRHLTLHAGRIA